MEHISNWRSIEESRGEQKFDKSTMIETTDDQCNATNKTMNTNNNNNNNNNNNSNVVGETSTSAKEAATTSGDKENAQAAQKRWKLQDFEIGRVSEKKDGGAIVWRN
jgi:hypothetical protein